jgi:hypothetical protein
MLLILLLLLLYGTGLLLLAMTGRTAGNGVLASVAARKMLRELKGLLGCSISFFGT